MFIKTNKFKVPSSRCALFQISVPVASFDCKATKIDKANKCSVDAISFSDTYRSRKNISRGIFVQQLQYDMLLVRILSSSDIAVQNADKIAPKYKTLCSKEQNAREKICYSSWRIQMYICYIWRLT